MPLSDGRGDGWGGVCFLNFGAVSGCMSMLRKWWYEPEDGWGFWDGVDHGYGP